MPRNTLFMFVEPGYGSSTWFAKSSAGLRAAAARREMAVEQLRAPAEMRQHTQAHSAVVVGASRQWTHAMIDGLRGEGVKPVLVGCSPQDFGDDISGPVFDRRTLVERMVAYFYRAGRRRLACVGNKLADANDELRRLAFMSGARKMGLAVAEGDVYGGEGDLLPIVSRFLDHAHAYDGAVCVNDQTAVHLIVAAQKRGIRVPEDLFVAGSGSLIIGSLITPTLTTAMLDYYQMGVQAVTVCNQLEKNPEIDAVCVTLPCQIICRGSTAFIPEYPRACDRGAPSPAPLPQDCDFERLDRIEHCLLRSDTLDYGVIRGTLLGQSAERIASELFVASGTVSYRLKKLYRLVGVANRQAFVALLSQYVTNPDVLAETVPGMTSTDLFIVP